MLLRSLSWGEEWSCYRGGHFNEKENGHVTEVVTLKEGEWSCYRGGVEWREHDHVTEEVSIMERE